jgi:hypothetical protein
MTKRQGAREPRLPIATPGLSASFVEVEQAEIIRTVFEWHTHHLLFLTSEASHEEFEIFFFEHLQSCEGSLTARDIVDVARLGHPAADRALRHFIQVCTEHHQQMPASVEDYLIRDVAARPPLDSGYGSTAPQLANNFMRDVAICWWVPLVKRRWPNVPLKNSFRHRSSAVALVGKAFGLSERQTLRIYEARGTLAEQLIRFFHGYRNAPTPADKEVRFVD